MGSENIKKMYVDAVNLKSVILQNNNLDILLYLAKYNPDVSRDEILEKFGAFSKDGLEALKTFHLVREENGLLSLTEEGIFQVDGLLSIAI